MTETINGTEVSLKLMQLCNYPNTLPHFRHFPALKSKSSVQFVQVIFYTVVQALGSFLPICTTAINRKHFYTIADFQH